MKQVVLTLVVLLVVQTGHAQTKCDSVFKQGELFLRRDLQAELNLVRSHVDDDRESHASAEWAYYLQRPNPAVATIQKYFSQAAAEFGVPQDLLEAIGQVENNWTQIGPSIDQGWGIMHLVQNDYCLTLHEAATLLGLSEQTLKDDARQNIRGAAALLRQYYGQHKSPSGRMEDWYPAASRFSGLISDELRTIQADRYYTVMKDGQVSRTLWGETITISKHQQLDMGYIATHFKHKARHHRDARSSDYTPAVSSFTTCNFVSSRNHAIDTWVNHWIGTGTAAGAVSWFQNCSAQVSAHFVTANNGTIYQVVPVAYTAWHCGVSGYPYNNGRSIGEEHEATVSNPSLWNSTAMLQASAEMACYFCGLYSIPTNQNHTSPGICGHQNMPGTNTDCPGTIPWSAWFSYFNSGNCNAQPPAQPANDYCGNAVPLSVYGGTCGGATAGDVNGATQSATPTSCDGYASTNANDVWYTFAATSTAHDITVVPSSGMDAVVDLRTACPGSTIACEDAGGGEGATEVLHATGLTIGATYYVRVYDYSGANNPPTTTTFTICVTTPCQPPVQPAISGNGTFCSGQTQTLAVSNPCSGCSFAWSNGATGNSTAVGISGAYTVTAVNACGSVSSAPFVVTVTPTPQPAIGNLSNAYCQASSDVTLTVSPPGGTLSGSGISGTVFSPSSAGVGTHNIVYTVTQNGCTGSIVQTTTVSSSPVVHISANGATAFCAGENVVLTATQGASYLWSTGATSQMVVADQSGTYDVTVVNPGGCSASLSADSTVTVTVYDKPVASAGADQTYLMVPNNSLAIGGSPAASAGTLPYTYFWSPPVGLNDVHTANPTVTGLTVSTTYVLSVTDAQGCTALDTVRVQVATACSYTPSPNYFHLPATGATDSFYVHVADTNCAAWTVSACNWINVIAPAWPHSGNSWVTLAVTPNPDSVQRDCVLYLTGGQTVLVVQDGAPSDPCHPSLPVPDVQLNFCDLAADMVSGVSYQWYVNGNIIPGANSRFLSATQSGYYYVLIADSNFCSVQSADLYVNYPGCEANGVQQLAEDETVFIYPNPAWGDKLQVEVPESWISGELTMTDVTGRMVAQWPLSKQRFSIDTHACAAGVYWLSFTRTGTHPVVKTLVKY